jgi:hypothetical protein
MGPVGLYNSVTGVASSATVRSPKTRQTRSPGSLGSPRRARTDQEDLANLLADYRPQERDQKRENNEGKVLHVGRAPSARNSGWGEEV